MFFVYILKLANGQFYKGQTRDLEKRLRRHDSGEVESTRNYLPYKLMHVEICSTRLEARKLEKYFKSGYGREIVKEFN